MKRVVWILPLLLRITMTFGQDSGTALLLRLNPSTSFSKPDSAMKFSRPMMLIPENFYTKRLGFFCRQEFKMQQAHIPVTFRLGSMEYCNKLEQKPGYRE